jgi:phosphatidylserine/phosphatidylglycerophosphate/cardiolipin synthase-like enzyme
MPLQLIMRCCFTPGQDYSNQWVHETNQTKHRILVQAYSFTSMLITEALVAAEQIRISVKVILDK